MRWRLSAWKWGVAAAIAIYCLGAFLLILQNPGLQYDEALLVLGGVQMRHSHQELALPHDPDTWFHAFHRELPLMTVRYVGALKDYLSLPLFALFGTSAAAVRALSTLLGALGIFGVARLIGAHVGKWAAVAAAFIIAINPAYLSTTVFDNGTVSIWMAALGLLCLALTRYLGLRTAYSAFLVGAAMGLGVWARANFVWQVAAVAIAGLVAAGRRAWPPISHWGALIAGGLAGGAPFLAYEIRSRGGTWAALDMFALTDSWAHRLYTRFVYLSETLLSDREHRAMWEGPAMPAWQAWLFVAIVLAACAWRLWLRERWGRAVALTFLILAAFLFTTRMPVSEHHVIALVPIAAVLTVLAASDVIQRYSRGMPVVTGLAILYIGLAIYWQARAIAGLHRTGGVGQWSEGISDLARELTARYSGREIKILDWGLQNNLFVLTDGKLRSREILGDELTDESKVPWKEELQQGGVFLLNGPENRNIPGPAKGFLDALVERRPAVRRVTIRQKDDAAFAEIIEILPDGKAAPIATRDDGFANVLNMGDARFERQLHGFFPPEGGGYRWTKGRFSITFGAPDLYREPDIRLTLHLFVDAASIRQLGDITLTALVGDHALSPETYRRSGPYTYKRHLQAGWLDASGVNRIDFQLDKSLPATPESGRELGIVLMSAALE